MQAQEFSSKYAALSQSDFIAKHKCPFLVELTLPSAVEQEGEYFTAQSTPVSGRIIDVLEAQVIPIKKSRRSNSQMIITIGRTDNNDIKLDVSSVSKLHAYVMEKSGDWFICDSQSANGTFIKDKRLEPLKNYELESPTEIYFGQSYSLMFLDTAGMYRYLQTLANILKLRKLPKQN